MKVLVVFTGGTIGSLASSEGLRPDDLTQSLLLQHYQNSYPNAGITFQVLSPICLLSENMQPSLWSDLIQALESEDLNSYDGVIITHGTDTLAYTANALSLCLSHYKLPIILVSAHTALDQVQSNAHINFEAALCCIENKFEGVYAAYQNPCEDFVSIFHAHELTQCLQLSSHFQALRGINASYKNQTLTHYKSFTQEKTQNLKALFSENIILIRPYPGLNYEDICLNENKIILHDLYHSGTCDINKIKPFIRQCKRQNVLLILSGLQKSDNYYETTQELLDMGVIFLYDISIEHAYVKLSLAKRNFSDQDTLLEYLV